MRHREPDDDLLSQANCSLSSARRRFTVLFGMGRGGTTSLWSSGIEGWLVALKGNELNKLEDIPKDREDQMGRDVGASAINEMTFNRIG